MGKLCCTVATVYAATDELTILFVCGEHESACRCEGAKVVKFSCPCGDGVWETKPISTHPVRMLQTNVTRRRCS